MKQALIVIDMLEDFVDGALANKKAQGIVGNIDRLADKVRAGGGIVVFANDAHLPGDYEERVWGQHALAGSTGAQVVAALAVKEGDYVVPKRFYSAFYETGLESLLRQNGVEEVIVAGQHADMCVRHTSADAFYRGFRVAVSPDIVAVFDVGDENVNQQELERALDYLVRAYGARVEESWQQV